MKQVTVMSEFTGLETAVLAGSCHAALFISILSPSSSEKEMLLGKKIREVRDFPSEWDLAGLLKACEKAHTAFQVVGEQKECCTNSPSGQTDVQSRFFTADEMAIFRHVTVS